MIKRKTISQSGFLISALLLTHTASFASDVAAPVGKDTKMLAVNRELEDLIDREAIRELPIVYCFLVHQKDVNGIVDLFTSDGNLTLSEALGGGAQGTEALRTFYQKSIDAADPWPFVHNHHVILLGKDRARGYIYAEIRYGSQGYRTVSIGVYEDEYEKVGGTWKFKSRVYKSHDVVN